jgi:hypothetical protein
MLLFFFIDGIEVAAIVGGLLFTVFFALVLNPPTKWLKPRPKDPPK